MRYYVVTMIAFLLVGTLAGQNNYIFNGNTGMGFARAAAASESNNSIFGGSTNDGHDANYTGTQDHHQVFAGGHDDGHASDRTGTEINSSIFAGGFNDGFDASPAVTQDHNSIFAGRSDDGFGVSGIASEDNSDLFAGGDGDGFGQSLISGSIWTGDVDKNWLMAGNWSSGIVPTVNHGAIIPRDVPRFPELHGLMLVGEPGPHIYTARSIWIHFGAAIYGVDASRFVNKGKLRVAGLLDLR